MVDKQKIRSEAMAQGKAVLQAVKIIKHAHLIGQLTTIQSSLMVLPFEDKESRANQIKEIESTLNAFRSGIELSGNSISKELKEALIKFVDKCLEFHRAD